MRQYKVDERCLRIDRADDVAPVMTDVEARLDSGTGQSLMLLLSSGAVDPKPQLLTNAKGR
jgi:hypothetical protein